VPLAACDLRGNRLGFGGGFYDRALVHQRGFKLGVGYSLQRVTHIESEPHDVRLDGFISEDGIEYF
jgi:5-formyltetrahydrofolate cyclo-ligase